MVFVWVIPRGLPLENAIKPRGRSGIVDFYIVNIVHYYIGIFHEANHEANLERWIFDRSASRLLAAIISTKKQPSLNESAVFLTVL